VTPDPDCTWYFAYGSNLCAETFRGRRGITHGRAVPARVPGWRLVFDKPGIAIPDEGYANLVPDRAAEVYGVLYELTIPEHAHVELTEGVALGNYHRLEVDAYALADGAPGAAARALTLASDRRSPGIRPTARYMALVIAGAEEHRLPDDWIAALRAVPAAPETDDSRKQRAILDDVLRALRRDR
jgi:hypothetical protein